MSLLLSSLLGVSPVLALDLHQGVTPLRRPAAVVVNGRAKERTENMAPHGPVVSSRLFAKRPPQAGTDELTGQTRTPLADGRFLTLGGLDDQGLLAAAMIESAAGDAIIRAAGDLHYARAWHTATMLPDGKVLVVGGIGRDGQVVATPELFDPETQSFEALAASRLTPRIYHTATLLTDGRVLLAGGLSSEGKALSRVELWDFRSKSAVKLTAKLKTARYNHRAALLPDGNVLLDGGADNNGAVIQDVEQYRSDSQRFSRLQRPIEPDSNGDPQVAGSVPGNGVADVALDAPIGVRFSRPLRVETINAENLTLTGPQGIVATKVVPAERGMLAFVVAKGPFLPDATYSLSVSGVSDESQRPIQPLVLTFKTSRSLLPAGDSGEEWTPDAANYHGDWSSHRPPSELQSLPALQAEPGVTAIAGQVLTFNGKALENVTLRVAEVATKTDGTGRFLLKSVPPGRQVLIIDGRTASRPGRTYGVFRYGLNVVEGKTNALPFTSWMPKLDMAHAVRVASPTKADVVITNPRLPGLELRMPSQTLMRDIDGQAVAQISITPVPTDRPAFPLPPGVHVPTFFTIQPGGAQVIPPRVRVIYPNFTNSRPGARVDFWNYDPTEKGWYVYGQGTVSPDGKQVIPDAGVVIYEFSGLMISSEGNPPGTYPAPGGGSSDGDPVDLGTGLFVLNSTDLVLPGLMPIALTRTYRPGDNYSRAFGIGTSHPYAMFQWSNNLYQEADVILPDGGRIHYVRTSPGTGYTDAVFEHTATPTAFYKSTITRGGPGWLVTLKNGTVFGFGDYTPLQYIQDRYGNRVTLTWSNGTFGNLTRIDGPNGRWIDFTYDTSNRITQATDSIGRTVGYTYDTGGRLWKVTNPKNEVTEYGYDASNRMTTIKDARGIVYLTNEYDANGRVIKQTQADTTFYQFAYTLDANGKVTQTDVTDPRGNVRRVTFNASGYMLTDTYALGLPEQQTYTYELQASTNLPLSMTDQLGRRTELAYDSMGNVSSVTRLAGTAEAVTKSFTYEPAFNLTATITDPLNHTTQFGYDASGNLTGVTDPLSHQMTFGYDAFGQMTSATNAVNKIIQLSYDGADLVRVTNPLGQSVTRFADAVGRTLSVTNALGQPVKYEYDALNRPTKVTDPLGGVTQMSYDENGNLLSVTDARNKVIGYHYDVMDRLDTRTDALLKQTTYLYDNNGNLRQLTDRKQQVMQFTYDALNRLKQVTYADNSTATYTYDAGNRLTQVADSISGTVIYGYDNLNRLTSETTALGTLGYGYDAAGRLTSKTIPSQAQIIYTYDNANRLTQIQQGAAVVTFAYDNANRLMSETMANGVVTQYGYDDTSRLASLTYRQGSTTLGDLTYEYDAAGRRVKVAGSLARTGLPQALSGASYNDANRQTVFGAATLTYDDNGNLTSDGANSYTWNARNQLVAMSGPGLTASFSYDAVGRRASKTINGSTTSYLYDGPNIVQEQTGGSASANLLAGGVDAFFSRADSTGTVTPLRDALGSVVSLTDAGGAVQTSYSYEPFGKTGATGTASSNSQKYTGREDDGTGLYYYRNRYYSPAMQRFISEDPVGLAGGINLFAYVRNNPISYSDPSGLKPTSRFFSFLAGVVDYLQPDPGPGSIMHHQTISELMRAGGYGVDEDDYGSGQDVARDVETGLEIYYGVRTGWELAEGIGEALARRRACFIAGTAVATPEGEKPIEQVRVGDSVLAADPEGGTAQPQKVTRTFVRSAPAVFDIRAGGATITATPEHPFWVEGKGWVEAGNLVRGSALLTKDGKRVEVESVSRREGTFQVYNFEVEPAHTYFVSRLAVLVHNQCRFTPEQDALIKLAKEAKRRGVTPEEAQALRQWADEVGLPSRGPEAHPGRPYGQYPHIHIGPVDHIPVR
jgi:RHS repeat-associated protein